MITKSEDKQLSLAEDGQIHWQEDASNPLIGPVIGQIVKGEDILRPKVEIQADSLPTEEVADAVTPFVQGWLERHLGGILAPLFTLNAEEGIDGPAKEIAQTVYDALGIIPREEVQSLIDQLDDDARNPLRQRRLRMGPVLVYLPELMKPAAVRLQALLWNLWNGLDLPAIVPADGIVSFSVRDETIDPKYYRAIGYPVFGPRAIRVDMLDRVVCAVYDSAKDGKFQAQHQMAEWLGSNIPDLYDILEAMGHSKAYDPLEEKIKQEQQEAETKTEGDPEKAEIADTSKSTEKETERPELATFRLKKGKASGGKSKPKRQGAQSKNAKPKKSKKGKKPSRPKERVISTGPKPKPEDSPFAVLQQLKVENEK